MPKQFVTPEQFKRLAKAGEQTSDLCIRKQFIAEVKAEPDADRVLTFAISTDSVDREGDAVALDGWDLSNFRRNPVVLWAHDYKSLPVARSLNEWKDGNRLMSRAEFTPAGMIRFNDIVFDLYGAKFLNAVSVGFLPRKWAWTEDEGRKYGIDYMEQELLEYSCVPVPANPEALAEARSMGIDTEPLKEWAKSILGEQASLSITVDTTDAQRAVKELADAAASTISDLDMRLRKAHIARLKSL